MKICILGLNSNLIHTCHQNEIIDFLKNKLYKIGESISLISYFDNNLEKIKNILNEDYQLIFVIGTSSSIYNHNIKENFCHVFNDKMVNSEASYKSLSKYCSEYNIPFSVQEEMEVLLPQDSIPLCLDTSYNNGFMYKFNDKYIIFFPEDLNFTINCYNLYVLPLIYDVMQIKKDHQTLKCFGILEKDLKNLIGDLYNQNDFEIQILNDCLDNTIYIRYDDSISIDKVQHFISEICLRVKKFLYATDDDSIYTTAKELLKLQNKKIAFCETITAGFLNFKLLEYDFDNYIDKMFVFNKFEDLHKEFSINQKIIDEYGKYSVNSVYEMSNILLEKSSADIVVFILSNKDEDCCYIAIGDIDGIHVYKNKINIRNKSTIENITKTAIFYLIKKLKQNDLHFI